MAYSDKQLISDYLAGDEKSFTVLVKDYLKPVFSFVCRYVNNEQEAEDITQEVFVKVWKNLKRFDPSKNFKTWIFTIAKNTALDYFKKKKTINFSVFENEAGENLLWETLVDPKPLSDEILMQANLTETMNMVIKHLTKKYQIVLFLYYYKNFTFKEISITLGESVNTVKSRHRRALLLLKKILPVKL